MQAAEWPMERKWERFAVISKEKLCSSGVIVKSPDSATTSFMLDVASEGECDIKPIKPSGFDQLLAMEILAEVVRFTQALIVLFSRQFKRDVDGIEQIENSANFSRREPWGHLKLSSKMLVGMYIRFSCDYCVLRVRSTRRKFRKKVAAFRKGILSIGHILIMRWIEWRKE